MIPKRGDRRYDGFGEFRVMAVADGYVMARRPRCQPTVFSLKEWESRLAAKPGPHLQAQAIVCRHRAIAVRGNRRAGGKRERELEAALRNIIECWEARSELYISGQQCAAVLADKARAALAGQIEGDGSGG